MITTEKLCLSQEIDKMKAPKKDYLLTVIISLLFTLLLSACGKKASLDPTVSATTKIENPDAPTTPTPGKVKAIKWGEARDFSILAYASISSFPSSNIGGRVGLMPGGREQIQLDPSEVAGGANDIITADDETIPTNLLSNAKVDMVTAYKNIVNLAGDKDKIGMHDGVIDEKTLVPGIYEWKNSMSISKDFTLEGSEDDVWIFKIEGHLNVGSGVRMILNGGIRPENIVWQVAGSVVLESESQFVGTIIAQPSIEMKSRSVLIGRAFCKNGYVNLHRAIIKKP